MDRVRDVIQGALEQQGRHTVRSIGTEYVRKICQGALCVAFHHGAFITVDDLDINSSVTFRTAETGHSSLTVTGAGNGEVIWCGQTTGWFRLHLRSSTGWDGTITDISTNKLTMVGGNGTTIRIENPGAVGTSTKIALNGTGAFVLHSDTGNHIVTIGELSGNSAEALITSLFESGPRHLRIEQSTDTTYEGRIDATDRQYTFEKAGAGRLRLTGEVLLPVGLGALFFTVSEGELYFNGTSTDLGTVMVKKGAIFGGKGDISLKPGGTLTIEDGGILTPGDVNDLGIATTGVLTIKGTDGAGLFFSGNATIRFNLNGDKIILDGGTLSGAAAGSSVITFEFSDSSPSFVGSTFDLIEFGGAPGIDVSHFAASPGWEGNFKYKDNTLQFTVTRSPRP